jgi:hypothetical protein
MGGPPDTPADADPPNLLRVTEERRRLKGCDLPTASLASIRTDQQEATIVSLESRLI